MITKRAAGTAFFGAVILVALTLVAYAQVRHFDFVNYDDNDYVYENAVVQEGLTGDGVAWAFTTGTLSNWHPVTWLSYMVDVQWFGVDPGAMHIVNVVFHLLNALLVLVLLWRLTGAVVPALLTAALFALHPLHVESVAWISERKDVLSTFFGLLALGAYGWYTKRPSMGRNAIVALLLGLGLMAKPMLVTWPFVFLLLDYWPLRRPLRVSLILEKWPHFVLIAASSVATYVAQQAGGAMRTTEAVPWVVRVQNAVMAYGVYLKKVVWPNDLGVFYPYPRTAYPTAWIVATAALLVVITVAVLLLRKGRPYLPVGWLWFLGTLVPVIGLIQVGDQAYADRYTYIPLIGLFLALAWVLWDLARSRRALRIAGAIAGVAVVGALTYATHVQAGYWRDSISLYTHTLAVSPDNSTVHYNLGSALLAAGRNAEAQEHLAAANALWPDNPNGLTNLAVSVMEQGDYAEATRMLEDLLTRHPEHLEAHINLAVISLREERWVDAIPHLEHALRIAPDDPKTELYLGIALASLERWQEAEAALSKAAAKMPEDPTAQYQWGRALGKVGRNEDAVRALERAVQLDGTSVAAWYQMGSVCLALGRLPEARRAFERVIELDPEHHAAELNLGIALASQNELPAAITHLRRSLEIKADSADAHFNLALALHLSGENEEARSHAGEALRLNPQDANAEQLLRQIGP